MFRCTVTVRVAVKAAELALNVINIYAIWKLDDCLVNCYVLENNNNHIIY